MRAVAALLASLLLAATAGGEQSAAPPAGDGGRTVLSKSHPAGDYVAGGSTVCTTCHDQPAVLSILKTPHAVEGDSRTPFAQAHACEVCHGPGADHVANQTPMPIRFGPETPAREQSAVCLTCHQGGKRVLWSGSVHDRHDVACASCHQVHAAEDRLRARDIRPETFVKHTQSRSCFECHPDVRAQTYLRSAHPLKQGLIECSDCHNVHGSTTDHLLAQETLNETCYECHAEKRGPFLWEHAPARESCANCHVPHGSNHPPLLEARGPWLCQSCHLAQFHPSGAYGGEGIPGNGAPNRNLLVKNCLNCHPEVHGSNHPSGVRFTR